MKDNVFQGAADSTGGADVARHVAKRIVDRVEAQFEWSKGRGKKADAMALELWCGACIATRALGYPDTADHLERLAVLLIATRGYSEVKAIANCMTPDKPERVMNDHDRAERRKEAGLSPL